MMYRDLGYTLEEIEKDLKDIGISTIYGSDRLYQYLGDEALKLSKIFKIGDSQYASEDGKMAWDYFFTAIDEGSGFDSGYYREAVNRSIDVAIILIVKNLIENFTTEGIKFQLLCAIEDGIFLSINKLASLNIEDVIESAVIRTFGRKFEVVPKIEIF